ncbi:Exostosin domain-containing protein [Heracleum sosnowskyi]|uniref:Exostosin domain-containing protein n=1 Tax=Heracleum sosnowskyi TaxID=360622 RepID=A0AAD8HFG9_9APIA|nr:Exostosin domain-containing protein [Heracleum sosnowskyi]
MEFLSQIQALVFTGRRRWIFVVVLVAVTHLFCQSLMLPYGNALLSLLQDGMVPVQGKDMLSSTQAHLGLEMINGSFIVNDSESAATILRLDGDGDNEPRERDKTREGNMNSDIKGLVNATNDIVDDNFPLETDMDMEGIEVENVDLEDDVFTLETTTKSRASLSLKQIGEPITSILENGVQNLNKTLVSDTVVTTGNALPSPLVQLTQVKSLIDVAFPSNSTRRVSISNHSTPNISLFEGQLEEFPNDGDLILLPSDNLLNVSANISNNPVKKKMRCLTPPKTITSVSDMNRLLLRNRRSSRAMRPRWSSARDQEILAAKSQIENAPIVRNNAELFSPLFRNVSTFKRSYEIMERVLKVYVYKDGEKPIFHQPVLKGLYASEGWFMKLMEGNRQYSVKDPRKAHLFYMPFSSRILGSTLYVPNSHNRTRLRGYLKNYSENLAAKYPFWNRTGGADHFLAACHDWAPYETRHHMEHCIRALCNTDVLEGFKIGRDVSLPETYVRSARNPQRDLGGKPPSQRHILAFYAGNMHGYLRPVLLKHWKDKDPEMKIFGPMPPGVASKMNYIQHMKSSKYCLCPKGYEVNSPRVVEAFFYECVPVIISDNFVPPFFEVLNWDAFAIILPEKDIPNLKNILLSISEEKYLEMQLAVRKVQRHFLWHAKPAKYDLFHMTLHSIWHNRVFQFKQR